MTAQIFSPENPGAPGDLAINLKNCARANQHFYGVLLFMVRGTDVQLGESNH